MTADDELINRVRDWGIRMGGRDLSWLTEGWPMLDHGTVGDLMSAPLAGARVDPPSRIEVSLPEGSRMTPEQEAALREQVNQPSSFLPSLTEAIAASYFGELFGGPANAFVETTGFDPASDSATLRLHAYRRHWLNRRVFGEPTAEADHSGYARRDVRWHLPPEGDSLLDSPAMTWVDETAAWADSGFACARESADGCACPECRTRHTEIESAEAVWLEILSRETEVAESPWAAAVNVFGASPPDVASMSL